MACNPKGGAVSRPLQTPSIVIASEAKQSHNTLISHEIAASRHASLAAKGSLAPRNDQNWTKVGVMQGLNVGKEHNYQLL